MRRTVARLLLGAAAALMATTMMTAPPASATVHEIVGAVVLGAGRRSDPPESAIPSRRNFAQPLNANGFIGPLVPFDGPAGPGLLITFNYDHPAAKVVGTGEFFVVGAVDGAPLYIEGIEPNPAVRGVRALSTPRRVGPGRTEG